MDRRRFLAGTLALLAAPLAADAQEYKAGKVYRIGYLGNFRPNTPETVRILEAFRLGLREGGWVEGRNTIIEWRYSEGRAERFPDLAAELVRLKVDLIVAAAGPATRAATQATTTIPTEIDRTRSRGPRLAAGRARENLEPSMGIGDALICRQRQGVGPHLPEPPAAEAIQHEGRIPPRPQQLVHPPTARDGRPLQPCMRMTAGNGPGPGKDPPDFALVDKGDGYTGCHCRKALQVGFLHISVSWIIFYVIFGDERLLVANQGEQGIVAGSSARKNARQACA